MFAVRRGLTSLLRRPIISPINPLRTTKITAAPLSSKVAASNPLLGIVPQTTQVAAAAPPAAAKSAEPPMVAYEWHKLPVSHNKLRLVAKLARGLYWREAMLQLEFCRKTIAVHIKNTIAKAVDAAEVTYGLNPSLLKVHAIRTGKGRYIYEVDYKAKGRAGMKSKYQSNVTVILKQCTPEEIGRTKFYERWRSTARMMELPWEERVQALPRYKRLDGYDPGVRRVPNVYADPATLGEKPRKGKAKPGPSKRTIGLPGGSEKRSWYGALDDRPYRGFKGSQSRPR